MNRVIHTPHRPLARVALDVPLDIPFDYLGEGLTEADLGRRVTVPFGQQSLVGVITELVTESDIAEERLKTITHIHRDTPPLPSDFLAFLKFVARYYHYPLGQVIAQALPPRLREPTPWSTRGKRRAPSIAKEDTPHPQHTLTAQQKNIVESVCPVIAAQNFAAFLLQGVTGSGKTEVYFEWVGKALLAGKTVLILLPEINLTPQLEARVRARFPEAPLLQLHSRLSQNQRAEAWLRLFEGGPLLVIGTRLAALAPLPNLGLLVVDEEHDSSFKQQEGGLRYSARDLALIRARDARCPIVLCSATPSLESLVQAHRQKYTRLKLSERADPRASLPQIELVDVRRSPRIQGLTLEAQTALSLCLSRGEQALVFINRRGYAPVLWCSGCGWCASCARCQSRLVFYRRARKAVCHLCGFTAPPPKACPTCGNPELIATGEGTERLEERLQSLFPAARIARVDTESMSKKEGFQKLRRALINKEMDMLVGTQMLAKGHDFPDLSTVIVVNPDSALFSADFRAEERLLAQLVQVAGRAGRRHKPGHVLIQTAEPAHPLFGALVGQDFDGYAEYLLKARQALGFPPYTFQAILRASHSKEDVLQKFLGYARSLLEELRIEGLRLFDPVPAAEPKIALKFRYQLLLQADSRAILHPALSELLGILDRYSGPRVQWVLDVDPQDV